MDTLEATLEAFCGMLSTLEVNAERMEEAAGDSAMLATDLADYLVAKGVPFREAHMAVGKLCELDVPLQELPIEECRRQSPAFDTDAVPGDSPGIGRGPRRGGRHRPGPRGHRPARGTPPLARGRPCLGHTPKPPAEAPLGF